MSGLAALLMLADGRYPAGGHAHSGGLEAAVGDGRVRDLSDLTAFLRGRLATAGLVAAAFAAAACGRLATMATIPATSAPTASAAPTAPATGVGSRGAAAAPRRNSSRSATRVGATAGISAATVVAELDAALDARTPSPVLRRVSRRQGRALARAAEASWPLPPLPPGGAHHPVVLGVVAAAAGLATEHAALAAAYGSIAGPAGAAVRLLGLDPFQVQAVLTSLSADCERVAEDATGRAADPVDTLPAASAPLLDIAAEAHATWEVRLFAS